MSPGSLALNSVYLKKQGIQSSKGKREKFEGDRRDKHKKQVPGCLAEKVIVRFSYNLYLYYI